MIDRVNTMLRRVPPWSLYMLAPLPVISIYYLGLIGELGVDPAKRIEHELGLWSLWLLIAGLAVTPLKRYTGLSLLRFRRAIGVITFFYLCAHLLTWLVLDVQFQGVWADIAKRWYITVGMASFVLMIPLALTSNNWSLRRLGAGPWRRLHKLIYPIAVLGAVHFVLLVKGVQWEPILYLGIVLLLLVLRLPSSRLAAIRNGRGLSGFSRQN